MRIALRWCAPALRNPPVNGFLLNTVSGGDALRGNTRPHPEHDG